MAARKNNTWQRLITNLTEWKHKAELDQLEEEQELERLKSLQEHLAQTKNVVEAEDLIDKAHDKGAWRERQKEHQARQYWQHSYYNEHPSELIDDHEIPEPVYRAKEKRDSERYGLTPSKLTPLDKQP